MATSAISAKPTVLVWNYQKLAELLGKYHVYNSFTPMTATHNCYVKSFDLFHHFILFQPFSC